MAKKGRRATAEERILAVKLIASGQPVGRVVDMLGVGRRTVFQWQQQYRLGGMEAMGAKSGSGRPTKISEEQMVELRLMLFNSNPREWGFNSALWTRALTRELIHIRFDVHLSKITVGRILKRLGIPAELPLCTAFRQDLEEVRIWEETVYPRIRKEADRCGATILFVDEDTLNDDALDGRMWSQRERTRAMSGTSSEISESTDRSILSALTIRGKQRFQVRRGRLQTWHFIEFCENLESDVSGRIFLIADGSAIHTSPEVREFMFSRKNRIRMFFFPNYSTRIPEDKMA